MKKGPYFDLNTVGGGGRVKILNPKQTPKQITLTATQAGTKSYFFLGDACGAAVALGLLNTEATGGTEFTVDGAGRTPLKELLKTYAIIIDSWDFESTEASEMSKNVNLIHTNQDGDSCTETLFTAKARSNMAENPLLLTINQSFILTTQTALKQPVTNDSTATNTLTLFVKAMVPYGNLDAYLESNPIYKMSAAAGK